MVACQFDWLYMEIKEQTGQIVEKYFQDGK